MNVTVKRLVESSQEVKAEPGSSDKKNKAHENLRKLVENGWRISNIRRETAQFLEKKVSRIEQELEHVNAEEFEVKLLRILEIKWQIINLKPFKK